MDSNKIECYGRMVDLISYQLGKITTCSEIVGAGVKDIALSSPLEPEEMEQLIDTAEEIVKNFNVSAYLEKDLLTTDLFDEDFTDDLDNCPLDNPDDWDGDGSCDSEDSCPKDAVNDI